MSRREIVALRASTALAASPLAHQNPSHVEKALLEVLRMQ